MRAERTAKGYRFPSRRALGRGGGSPTAHGMVPNDVAISRNLKKDGENEQRKSRKKLYETSYLPNKMGRRTQLLTQEIAHGSVSGGHE